MLRLDCAIARAIADLATCFTWEEERKGEGAKTIVSGQHEPVAQRNEGLAAKRSDYDGNLC